MKIKYVELIRLIRGVDSTNKKWISTSAKEESIWTALGVYNSFRSESKNLNYFTASRHHFLNQKDPTILLPVIQWIIEKNQPWF